MLTEKYPPRFDEIVGLAERNKPEAKIQLKEYIEKGIPCIAYGNPGIGKTSTVYAIADDLGFYVIEFNASDKRRKEELTSIYNRIRTKTFVKTLFLLDEADGITNEALLTKIVVESIHPIVLTANQLWKIPKKAANRCKKVRFMDPRLEDVLERVKGIVSREGVRVSYDRISRDVRSSINATLYGSGNYEKKNDFETIRAIFKGRGVKRELSKGEMKDILTWLVDNGPNFYMGKDLHDFYELLGSIDLIGRSECLKLIPKGRHSGRVRNPYFLRRMKFWGGNKTGQ